MDLRYVHMHTKCAHAKVRVDGVAGLQRHRDVVQVGVGGRPEGGVWQRHLQRLHAHTLSSSSSDEMMSHTPGQSRHYPKQTRRRCCRTP